ncbi:hypothetical protein NDU88_001954 [Pleurodeles waltl]|uniref:Uncharacterized protein n=1 Tax=Pleurodeles waltl TaxID=8319 RepID=A0AAV7W1J9_PLEWA|nr:hypothetical protein NDU88_001954 [Pleurodeles waltl]
MWEGGQAPTEGRNLCSGPRHVTIFMPPRSRDRAQAAPDATEAQAECERHLSQVSARGGPGAPSPLLLRVQRCSGPRSAVRSAALPAKRAPGPGRPGRTRLGRGAGDARAAPGQAAHSSSGSRRALEPQHRPVGSRWLRSALT